MKILEPLLTKMGRGGKKSGTHYGNNNIVQLQCNIGTGGHFSNAKQPTSGDNERTDFTFTPHYFVSKLTLLDLQNRSQNLSNRIYTPALPSMHCKSNRRTKNEPLFRSAVNCSGNSFTKSGPLSARESLVDILMQKNDYSARV